MQEQLRTCPSRQQITDELPSLDRYGAETHAAVEPCCHNVLRLLL